MKRVELEDHEVALLTEMVNVQMQTNAQFMKGDRVADWDNAMTARMTDEQKTLEDIWEKLQS